MTPDISCLEVCPFCVDGVWYLNQRELNRAYGLPYMPNIPKTTPCEACNGTKKVTQKDIDFHRDVRHLEMITPDERKKILKELHSK